MNDLFYNAGGGVLFLRIDDAYYKRELGRGWTRITPEQAEVVPRWDALHELQRKAYVPMLQSAGLVD